MWQRVKGTRTEELGDRFPAAAKLYWGKVRRLACQQESENKDISRRSNKQITNVTNPRIGIRFVTNICERDEIPINWSRRAVLRRN